MPGLLRGIARTAVAAGTLSAVSNGVSRRQANRWARQDEQQYYEQQGERRSRHRPPRRRHRPHLQRHPEHTIQQLKDLADLKAQGILTDEEFAAEKAKILAA